MNHNVALYKDQCKETLDIAAVRRRVYGRENDLIGAFKNHI